MSKENILKAEKQIKQILQENDLIGWCICFTDKKNTAVSVSLGQTKFITEQMCLEGLLKVIKNHKSINNVHAGVLFNYMIKSDTKMNKEFLKYKKSRGLL